MTSVLMIDDDVEFCAMLRDFLSAYSIAVTPVHEAGLGLAALKSRSYDLILLDVMLPDADGLSVLTQIAPLARVPVLILSAEGSEATRIDGLDRGADDFLAKPFNPRELVARIHAVLRRSESRAQSHANSAVEDNQPGLTFDVSAKQAFYRGERLALTGVEFDLLSMFATSPGTVLEREMLVNRVFQRPFNPLDRSLDMHISRLRRKLSLISGIKDPIKTIRSSGYVFCPRAGEFAGAV